MPSSGTDRAAHRVLGGDCVGTSPLVTRRHAARRGAIHARGLARSGAALGGRAPAAIADRRSRARGSSGVGRERPGGNPSDCSSRPIAREFVSSTRLELEGDGDARLYLTARVATGLHEVTVVPARQASRDASLPGPVAGRTTIVATVTHADGRHLERLEIDRAAWIAAPAPVAEYAQRPAGPDASPASPDPAAPRGVLARARPVSDGLVAGVRDGGGAGRVRRRRDGRSRCHRPARVAGECGVRSRWPRDRIRELRLSPVPSCAAVRSGLLDLAARAARRIRGRRAAAPGAEAVRRRRRRVSVGDVATTDARQRELRDRRPASRKPRRRRGACGRRSDSAGTHTRRRRSGTELRQRAGGAAVDFGARRRPDVGVDRLPEGHGGRSLALGLGSGGIRLSIVSVMDDGRTAGAGGDRAHRRTARTGGRSSDRRRRRNDRHPRRRRYQLRGARLSAGICSGQCALECAHRNAPADCARQPRSWAHGRSICEACRERGSSTASGPPVASIGWEPRNFFPPAPRCRPTSTLFSFFPFRIRTGVGVPLKSLGPVSRGEARFYVTAGTSF